MLQAIVLQLSLDLTGNYEYLLQMNEPYFENRNCKMYSWFSVLWYALHTDLFS